MGVRARTRVYIIREVAESFLRVAEGFFGAKNLDQIRHNEFLFLQGSTPNFHYSMNN